MHSGETELLEVVVFEIFRGLLLLTRAKVASYNKDIGLVQSIQRFGKDPSSKSPNIVLKTNIDANQILNHLKPEI